MPRRAGAFAPASALLAHRHDSGLGLAMAHVAHRLILVLALLALFSGCERRERVLPEAALQSKQPRPFADSLAAKALPAAPAQPTNHEPGDAARGRALVERFECNRCHDGTGLQAAAFDKHCVRCHSDIWAGKFRARSAAGARWKEHIEHVRVAPSLEGLGRRLRLDYVEGFVREPHDVRPHLAPTMPRLTLTAEQARDVAAHLASLSPASARAEPSLGDADLARGRQLLETRVAEAATFSAALRRCRHSRTPKPAPSTCSAPCSSHPICASFAIACAPTLCSTGSSIRNRSKPTP